MYGGHSVFPHCFCSAKGPPGCPGRESNPGPTERQAGVLTIELRLTPVPRLTPVLRLIPAYSKDARRTPSRLTIIRL